MKKFTLIELLVVIAIIGILASLLLPVLGKARKTAKLGVCKSQLKQIGATTYMYADDNNDFIPPAPAGVTNLSWDDQLATYDQRNLSDAVIAGTQGISTTDMSDSNIYLCPSDEISSSDATKVRRSYSFNNGAHLGTDDWGLNRNFNNPDPFKFNEVNSPADCLMTSEWSHAGSYLGKTWYSVIGKTSDIDTDMTSPHEDTKFNVLYVDGHVDTRLKYHLQANTYQIFMNKQ
ncbi:type II secretion system protein [Lentisphaera marina]|uniref:type II secretion system protein n=1 Tax=Lentisphaera marina TaxID=1111041 RepID=UPI002366BB15|nr:type II secretion system protein [Lentisphaera marina]MDD7985635.1 type II secretion system protein [Lentisphaera marina]